MKEKNKRILLWILDLLINIGVIFILVLIIQKWLIAPFDVSGASMCDTLNIIKGKCETSFGEKIIINEAAYLFNKPERGDIVVFKNEDSAEKYFIKRIIGLPGDTVELKDGEVFLTPKESNKKIQLNEDYLNEFNKGNTEDPLKLEVLKIPEDRYFVMGDNRQNSTDSRSCFSFFSVKCKENPIHAFVKRKEIRGKAWIVWWPLQNMRIIKHKDYPEIPKNEAAGVN